MKVKLIVFAVSFLLIAAGVSTAIYRFGGVFTSVEEVAPAGKDQARMAGAPFCEPPKIREVDFTVLEEVDFIVRTYSVFTSPEFRDVFGDTKKDQSYLMRNTLHTLFGFLAEPVPAWAQALVEQEISSGNYDYGVFNTIYGRIVTDSKYAYLKDPQKKEELLKVSIEGMIKALGDPFTAYLPPDYWILSNQGSSEGRYRGLGVSLSKNGRGEVVLDSVAPGEPAANAGLRSGDAIVAVDGKTTYDCSVQQFILTIKARQDPAMTLTIRRALTGDIQQVQLIMEDIRVRDLVTYPGVDLPDGRGSTMDKFPYYAPIRDRSGNEVRGILYLGMKEFTVQMAEDLRYALEHLDTSAFSGIIVDLRGNPGGRLDAIMNSVDYFLSDAELIVTTKYVGGSATELKQDKWDLVPEKIPVVILVDKNSASGAELFPSALHDNGRAIIISNDERTAGKGSVNNHYTLRKGKYGALYVSIGLWYTPSGQLIEAQDRDKDGIYEIGGLKPDIKVDWTDEDIRENQRNPAWWDPTILAAIDYLHEHAP